MSRARPFSWIPVGVVAALILSLAAAWAFRERRSRATECAALYAAALTAADSARIDTVATRPGGFVPSVTCGELLGRAGRER